MFAAAFPLLPPLHNTLVCVCVDVKALGCVTTMVCVDVHPIETGQEDQQTRANSTQVLVLLLLVSGAGVNNYHHKSRFILI